MHLLYATVVCAYQRKVRSAAYIVLYMHQTTALSEATGIRQTATEIQLVLN
jgi:hypothetical protein